jgi:hypothetical protein
MAEFANPYVRNGLWQFDDVTSDVGVDLNSKNADPIKGATERDPLVEREHFLQYARGLLVRWVRRPLRLEIFQFWLDATGQGCGQGMDNMPRRRRCLLANTRPQPRALQRHFAVGGARVRRLTVLVAQSLWTADSGCARSSILSPASQPTRIAPLPNAITSLRVSDSVATGCGRGAQ